MRRNSLPRQPYFFDISCIICNSMIDRNKQCCARFQRDGNFLSHGPLRTVVYRLSTKLSTDAVENRKKRCRGSGLAATPRYFYTLNLAPAAADVPGPAGGTVRWYETGMKSAVDIAAHDITMTLSVARGPGRPGRRFSKLRFAPGSPSARGFFCAARRAANRRRAPPWPGLQGAGLAENDSAGYS